MSKIQLYIDGGCKGNPGIGGYGIVNIIDGKFFNAIGHTSDKITTNNEQELLGAYNALIMIEEYVRNKETEDDQFEILSDSNYVIRGINEWAPNWMRNGSIHNRPNSELWINIFNLLERLRNLGCKISFSHVRGHRGIKGNEYADKVLNLSIKLRRDIMIHQEELMIDDEALEDYLNENY